MSLAKYFRWFKSSPTRRLRRATPQLVKLESREVPAGYLAAGAGPGGLPAVTIRVDIQDALGGSAPTNLGQTAVPRSDGKTDFTSQTFFPFATTFRGGVHVATGNFDGQFITPDQLVTAAGPGGGPHVIVWNTKQNADGGIVVTGIRDQFFAYDARFRGGVNVATGDLDGDGRAELITGAGPGGGPHVRIWKEVAGHFQIVNEFFAFDAGFRGGVTLASGQGYKTIEQLRFVTDKTYGFGSDTVPFVVTPYDDPTQAPGFNDGIPLVGLDYDLLPGETETFANFYGATGTPHTVPAGNVGNYHVVNGVSVPFTYFTVAAGATQYLSGNLLESFGNVAYRPVINIPAGSNPDNIGKLVTAKWTAMSTTLPPGGLFVPEVEYGPFVRIGKTSDSKDIITRLTLPPDAVTFKNDLVIGAGPGGGPHVKIYDFTGTASGKLINNGVGKEFFAFDPSFRGGVNVGIGNVLEHQDPARRIAGRIDYTQNPPVFITDTTANSGTQVFNTDTYDTELFRRDQPEVIVSMASGGSDVVIFADASPKTSDPTNPFTDFAPARRTSLSQLNLQPFFIDRTTTLSPNSPLGGYNGLSNTNVFRRAVDNSTNFTGGVSFIQGAFNFLGSADTRFYGFGTLAGGTQFPVNPVLGQSIFGAGATPPGQSNRGSRVRLFNQMTPRDPVQPGSITPAEGYDAYDDFQAFPADPAVQGVSLAFGFGQLPEPGLDINHEPRNPAVVPTAVESVDDPILI